MAFLLGVCMRKGYKITLCEDHEAPIIVGVFTTKLKAVRAQKRIEKFFAEVQKDLDELGNDPWKWTNEDRDKYWSIFDKHQINRPFNVDPYNHEHQVCLDTVKIY